MKKKNSIYKENRINFDSTSNYGLLFETYFGLGTGDFGFENVSGIYYKYQFQFRKPFFQTGIHWQGKVGGIGLFYRLGRVNFYKGVLNGQFEFATYDIGNAIVNNNIFTTSETGFSIYFCLLYTSPSPRDQRGSRMPSSA